jgi:hypothetical protein
LAVGWARNFGAAGTCSSLMRWAVLADASMVFEKRAEVAETEGYLRLSR